MGSIPIGASRRSPCPGAVIGSQNRVKIGWPKGRVGSTPTPGTILLLTLRAENRGAVVDGRLFQNASAPEALLPRPAVHLVLPGVVAAAAVRKPIAYDRGTAGRDGLGQDHENGPVQASALFFAHGERPPLLPPFFPQKKI